MPVSAFQARVLKTIASNRSPDSYLAGATVLHRKAATPRVSEDLDLFHDVADSVARSAEQDAASLMAAGLEFTWLLRTPVFCRAMVAEGNERLKLEWAQDSAFRFFPVQKDPLCGYRLHDADAAVNKVLAFAGRNEVRDYVDVLHLDKTYLSLGALAWAGCGKDPGFTPEFLLDHASRHTMHTQTDIDRLNLRRPLDVKGLKKQWLLTLENARRLVANLPPEEVGCLYLSNDRIPVTPDPAEKTFAKLARHRGSVRGAWPSISPEDISLNREMPVLRGSGRHRKDPAGVSPEAEAVPKPSRRATRRS